MIQEKLESDGRVLYEIWKQGKEMNYNEILDWHTSSLTAIIRNEIDRNKLLLEQCIANPMMDENGVLQGYNKGYNTAINEDIAYLENVLEEIEKSV